MEKIICETPTPAKKPTRIDKWKFDLISRIILEVLPSDGEGMLFKELPELVARQLDDEQISRLGSVGWYTTTVKLDLECKERITRVPDSNPQRLRKSVSH